MCSLNVILKILILLPIGVMTVKIGVSKTSTTTTTQAPNPLFDETVNFVSSSPTISTTLEIDTTTLTAKSNETSTTAPKTTTLKPTTTTTNTPKLSSNLTTSKPTVKPIESIDEAQEADAAAGTNIHFYCSCDLTPSTCDINCCCDRDCDKQILKVFDCFTPAKYPELRLVLDDFQYEHGLPSCKINDGWLCVFRTNKPLNSPKKVYELDFDTANKYKWPGALMELTESSPSKQREFYKFGEQLRLLNVETMDIEYFNIPYAYKPPFCQVNLPIRHLKSTTTNCLLTSSSSAQEARQKFITLAATNKLLSKPRDQLPVSMDSKDLTKDFQLKSCTFNNEAKDYICQEIDLSSNDTQQTHELFNIYAIEIRLKFFHNFTDLMGCQIEFIEEEHASNVDHFELWQKYSVEFISSNDTDEKPSHRGNAMHSKLSFSGPLGYLQNEPIIVSKFITKNQSEELSPHNRIMDYFKYSSIENNSLMLLNRRAGLCQRVSSTDHSINYGLSSLTQCTLRIGKENLAKFKANITNMCIQLQKIILSTLFGAHASEQLNDLTELYISTLGRPQNTTEKWLKLHVENLDFAPTAGLILSESQTLVCRNILLSAAFEFHIGAFTEDGKIHQNLVKHAVLKLGKRHDLEFTLDERFEVPLTLTVMFYDLSLNTGSPIVAVNGINGFLHLMLTIFVWQFT